MAGTEYSVLKDKKYENYNTAHAPEGSEASAESITSHLPFYLKTDRQRWTAFCITTVMCALASGPVSAWPTLEPVLMKADLFKGMGQEQMFGAVYSFSIAAQLGVSLPAGWLYDRYGGRFCCFWGALVAAVGLLLMAASVFWPVQCWWAMFLGYPIAMIGGQINTYGIFVFIWILPEHQNFVSSAAGAVTSLSDMLALVAVALSDCCGLFIGTFFLLIAGLSVIAGVVCWAYVPTKQVMLDVAGTYIHADAAAIARSEEEEEACCGAEMLLLREAWKVMRKHAVANSLLLAFSTAYVLSILYPMQEMLYYYRALFPAGEATDLVNLWAVIYGIGGFLCAIAGGALCDKTGIRAFTLIVVGCCMFVVIMLPIPSFAAQIAGQVGITMSLSLYTIVVNRFCMLYASPDLFGTLGGLQFTIISVAMFVCMQALSAVNESLPHQSKATRYQVTFVVCGVVATALGSALAWYWGKHPPPALGDHEPGGMEAVSRDPERV